MEAVASDKAGHSVVTKTIDELREMPAARSEEHPPRRRRLEDFLFWLASARKTPAGSPVFISEIQRDPFGGIGKPEPLMGELSGYWSRRIDDEHRLVYRADDTQVKILKPGTTTDVVIRSMNRSKPMCRNDRNCGARGRE
jgi:toxin YoeB